MKRYAILLSYDGSPFSGWQIQPNASTIQGEIEKAFSIVLREKISLHSAGRTDTGVHAEAQVAHFDTEKTFEVKKFLYSVNSILPKEIRIFDLREVNLDFHARFSAISKSYCYLIKTGLENPLLHRFTHFISRELDLIAMEEAKNFFIGKHDFRTFANEAHRGSAKNSPVKVIFSFEMSTYNELLLFEIKADGFLYKMVRNIMGVLIQVGLKKISSQIIPALLESKNRQLILDPAPAKALFLKQIYYHNPIFQENPPGLLDQLCLLSEPSLKQTLEEPRSLEELKVL